MPPRSQPYTALAVVAGFLSSLAAGLFLVFLAPALRLSKIDYPYLLGQLEVPEGKLSVMLGWLLFLLGGVLWALFYAHYLHNHLPGPGWLQGLTYGGIGIFLLSSVVVFPLMGLHPWVEAGKLAAPGFFAFGLSGWKAVFTTFLGHCLYGILLGRIYRRHLIFSSS